MLALAACLAGGLTAEVVQLTPDEFKAVTLAKVSPHVEWPKSAWPGQGSNFVIGIFGTNTVQPILAALLQGQKAGGRDVLVKTFPANTNSLPHCQLLFIPAAQETKWLLLSKNTNTFGLLTVGESTDFTRSGGVVFNLLTSEQKLEINLKNAKKAGLEIDFKLLRISKVIK